MSKRFRGTTKDGAPLTQWPMIHEEAAKHSQFTITVDEYNEEKEITMQQMAYLHAVVFPRFAKEMHCSLLWAEITLKRCCGEQWLIKRVDKAEIILSKTVLTVKQCKEWITNILDWCEDRRIYMPEPDKEWYKKKEESNECK